MGDSRLPRYFTFIILSYSSKRYSVKIYCDSRQSYSYSNDENYSESHPVSAFLDLLPNEQGDDPLLAVACQNLLIVVDGEIAGGKDFATLEVIVTELDKSGISFEEIDEAIEHLLMSGAIIEVEDDCFITI